MLLLGFEVLIHHMKTLSHRVVSEFLTTSKFLGQGQIGIRMYTNMTQPLGSPR